VVEVAGREPFACRPAAWSLVVEPGLQDDEVVTVDEIADSWKSLGSGTTVPADGSRAIPRPFLLLATRCFCNYALTIARRGIGSHRH
jgi:hypothetical protein